MGASLAHRGGKRHRKSVSAITQPVLSQPGFSEEGRGRIALPESVRIPSGRDTSKAESMKR